MNSELELICMQQGPVSFDIEFWEKDAVTVRNLIDKSLRAVNVCLRSSKILHAHAWMKRWSSNAPGDTVDFDAFWQESVVVESQ